MRYPRVSHVEATIRIEVSDDEFEYCSDAWTVEVSCVDGELGGTGGSGGSGGTGGGGAGGSGGSPGTGGSGGEGGFIDIGFTASTEDSARVRRVAQPPLRLHRRAPTRRSLRY
jgi:hypothetical protein